MNAMMQGPYAYGDLPQVLGCDKAGLRGAIQDAKKGGRLMEQLEFVEPAKSRTRCRRYYITAATLSLFAGAHTAPVESDRK